MTTTTEPATATTTEPAVLRGCDLYHDDGDVQFHALAAAGLSFTIAKSSQGLHMQDPAYAQNRARAYAMREERGFWGYGAYHFFDPDADPALQVLNFLDAAQPKSGDARPALDVETLAQEHHLDSLDERAREAAIKIKIETSFYPQLYGSESFLASYLPLTRALCPLWVARYGPKPATPGMRMWQYTDAGVVAGIPHALDLDIFYGGQDDWNALCLH